MTDTRTTLLKRLEAEALQYAFEHPTRMRLVGPTVPLRARYGMSAEAIAEACRCLLQTR